jgi:hypothetical protein
MDGLISDETYVSISLIGGNLKTTAIALLITFLFSPSARAMDYPSYESFVDLLKTTMIKACEIDPSCIQRVTSFAYFLWKNRDKADIQYNAMKCLGSSAIKRGYVWSPTKVLDDLTPKTSQEIAYEVCDCVVGYWGKDWVCPIPR